MAASIAPEAAGIGRVVARVLAIAVGAYAASSAIVAAGVALLILAGVNRSDAFTVCSILGFALYVTLALWAAAARRLPAMIAILLLVTAGGAAIAALPTMLGKA
jgi:hypothetical protein